MKKCMLFCIILIFIAGVGCTPDAISVDTPAPEIEETPVVQNGEQQEEMENTFLGEQIPQNGPEVFLPGIVSGDQVELSLSIHPNLEEIYFSRIVNGRMTIMTSRKTENGWSDPEAASFSGEFNDLAPFVSVDGQRLYFSSDRNSEQGDSPFSAYRIWYVERSDEDWSEPVDLELPIESIGGEMHPTLTLDGSLYYFADYPSFGGEGVYCSRFVDGQYLIPEKINILTNNDQIVEVEPFIAADESFLLFYSAGRPDNLTPEVLTGDIYIVFRNPNGTWGQIQNLGSTINSEMEESTPVLSPDGKFLFFASNFGTENHTPDIFWVPFSIDEILTTEVLERGIMQLGYDDLMSGNLFAGPVAESLLTPPKAPQAALNRFEGSLELIGEIEGGNMEVLSGALGPEFSYLPEFNFEFVQTEDGYLVPIVRGMIVTDHPYWNIHLEPGKVWQEEGDQGYSRASLPFTLSIKGNNASFNGTLTFLFNQDEVSKVWYQITQEITTSTRANFWGMLDAKYTPGVVENAEQIRSDFARELSKRVPMKPIEMLQVDYPEINPEAFGAGVNPEDMSWYGFLVNGVNYVGGCTTRFGIYPYCEAMRATSYSTAKSAYASVALMRLSQLYGIEVADMLIKDYVPEYSNSSGDWENVTFNNTIDMATGNYFSKANMMDDNSQKMGEFFGAQPYSARIEAAFTAPYQSEPGTVWVYRTSDTFILIQAMQAFLQEKTDPDADLFNFIADEVYSPMGVGPGFLTTMRTKDNNWTGTSEGGMGLWWTPDDVAKIAILLNNNKGMINGEQILQPDMLNAALQNDPEDRGLFIGGRSLYNNAFWATLYTTAQGYDCEFYVVEMQGVSGNVIVLMPNGTTYYYFSDSQAFTWDLAVKESNKLIPFCSAD